MAAISVNLPWPPAGLSPNARLHWAQGAKVKAAYKNDCWTLGLEARGKLERFPLQPPVTIALVFLVKTKRGYDLDNLVARMKSGIDGLVTARLLWDDTESYLKWAAPTIERGALEAGVRVTLTEATP